MEGNSETEDVKGSLPEPPLDMKRISVTNKEGRQIVVHAINIGFMEPRLFVRYKPPPPSCFEHPHYHERTINACSKKEWVNRMLYIQEDLHWLLKLPHHRFWSQVIHDDHLQQCLLSYLSHGPRKYDLSCKLKDAWAPMLKNVHRLVFMAHLRMATYKESQVHYITPLGFGNLIYEYFIFDIPKIMDLCAIYGQENEALLRKMVTNIFNNQPKYKSDLEKAVPCILKFFSEVECVLNNNITCEPVEDYVRNNTEGNSSALHSLLAATFCVTEACGTLSSFLNIYPPACNVFYKNGTAIQIARFYDAVFPALEYQYRIRRQQNELEGLLKELKCCVTVARELALKVFRCIVVFCFIQPVMEGGNNSNLDEPHSQTEYIDELVHMFKMVALESSCFMFDYIQLFPIETDLSLLCNVCPKKSLKQLKKISYAIKQQLSSFKNTSDSDSSSSVKRNSQVLLKCHSENTTADDVVVPNTLLPELLQKLDLLGERTCMHDDDDGYCDSCDIPLVNVPEVETEVELSCQ